MMEQADPVLEGMLQVAQPLDEWCDFCTIKLATMTSKDGKHACQECAEQVLRAIAQYETEGREAATVRTRANLTRVSPGAAKAKAKRRAKRKRTKR